MSHQTPSTHDPRDPVPALWRAEAPPQFDLAAPWWAKVALMALLTVIAIYFLDAPVAAWAMQSPRPFWDMAHPDARKGDIARELMMLEQFGQWTCTILVLIAVALIDRAGPRKALAIAFGCLATVILTYLLKDTFGRCRPHMFAEAGAEFGVTLARGDWVWGGPARGFTRGSSWGSFPSAHTTGAFALAAGLSWFYPRGRGLFVFLATVTAAQRVLHAAHFVSDTLAGIAIGVGMARTTLHLNIAGRLIAMMPPPVRAWWLKDRPES